MTTTRVSGYHHHAFFGRRSTENMAGTRLSVTYTLGLMDSQVIDTKVLPDTPSLFILS